MASPGSYNSELPHLSELGRLASWSVSSHKYGFGVENLRDNNEFTFWQ
jgi:anaphase-promoting complex subunit 10